MRQPLGAEERQWLIDVGQVAGVAEPWRERTVPVSNNPPPIRLQGAAEVRDENEQTTAARDRLELLTMPAEPRSRREDSAARLLGP